MVLMKRWYVSCTRPGPMNISWRPGRGIKLSGYELKLKICIFENVKKERGNSHFEGEK